MTAPAITIPAPATGAGAGPRTLHAVPTPPPAPTPLVVGIDPSLRSLGLAGPGWTDALRTKATGHHRMAWLRAEVADRTKAADLVVIEGPAHGQALQAGHHEMAGLWWILTHDLWRRKIPTAICSPHSRTIYATGAARHKDNDGKWLTARQVKGLVRDAVAERYGIECTGPARYDEADAYVMCALGLHWLGHPLAAVPDTHRRALEGVQWPDTVPAVAR